MKAVCACKNMAETATVIAVKRGRFAFIDKWGFFTWIMFAILSLATGGVWILIVVGWHLGKILNPKYHCNQCDSVVPEKQFRI
jgi:hypothetical protein